MSRRRLTAVVSILVLAAIGAAVLAKVSTRTFSNAVFKPLPRLAALHEGGQQGNADAAEAAAEAYSDRAYPADEISIDQIQGAIAAERQRAEPLRRGLDQRRGTSSVRTR